MVQTFPLMILDNDPIVLALINWNVSPKIGHFPLPGGNLYDDCDDCDDCDIIFKAITNCISSKKINNIIIIIIIIFLLDL